MHPVRSEELSRLDLDARDMAVVDIGSNSVRLAVYHVEGRTIWPIVNEKVLAGLGRRSGPGRRLSPQGVLDSLSALRRFAAVLEGVRPARLFAVATAAVREAEDGPAFVTRIKAETGLEVRVLTGAEEARYAALGVMAGQGEVEGLVGDLGGSSLELVQIAGGRPGRGVTLPLGPFALGAPGDLDVAGLRTLIAERLSALPANLRGGCLHAVGGAWRNIALIQMESVAYPLRLVHQYEMSGREALDVARFVARQSKASLERTPGVSRKRAETLPYAALVLEGLVQYLELERVRLSAFGLREGLILDAMAPDVRAQDPLVEGCAALGARQGVGDRLASVLQGWLTPFWHALPPLFAPGGSLPTGLNAAADAPEEPPPGPTKNSPASDARLLAAACRLSDIGARLHPDHRADLAFDQVLRAPIPGQTHAERAFLAVAVFARYTAQAPWRAGADVERLLSPERLRRARALGAAMRLGCDLSARAPELLAGCSLRLERRRVVLQVSPACADLLLGEQTRKRLQTLADLLDAPPLVQIA